MAKPDRYVCGRKASALFRQPQLSRPARANATKESSLPAADLPSPFQSRDLPLRIVAALSDHPLPPGLGQAQPVRVDLAKLGNRHLPTTELSVPVRRKIRGYLSQPTPR